MKELLVRFLVGGVVVSAFAMLGDLFRPKSFAGLFGAAPSVALATLGLTIGASGHDYASIEARSMVAGAIALFLYTSAVSRVMMSYKWPALATTIVLLPAWFGAAFGLWLLWWR
jgi:hypothetical protein